MIDRQAVLERVASRICDAAEEAEAASIECSLPPHRPERQRRPTGDDERSLLRGGPLLIRAQREH